MKNGSTDAQSRSGSPEKVGGIIILVDVLFYGIKQRPLQNGYPHASSHPPAAPAYSK